MFEKTGLIGRFCREDAAVQLSALPPPQTVSKVLTENTSHCEHRLLTPRVLSTGDSACILCDVLISFVQICFAETRQKILILFFCFLFFLINFSYGCEILLL